MSVWGTVRRVNVRRGSVPRGNVFTELSVGEKSFGEKSVGEMSVGELSGYRNIKTAAFRRASLLKMNPPWMISCESFQFNKLVIFKNISG